MASGSTGRPRAILVQRSGALVNSPGATAATVEALGSSRVDTMAHLFRQANARINIRIEQIDDQIDQHDHDSGFHDDPLNEREIALENPLIEEAADARP